MPPLTDESDALAQILDRVPPADPIPVALEEACGHFLGEDLIAEIPSPPFDCSSMDGYALAQGASEYGKGSVFPLATGEVAAGGVPAALDPGAALRIFTGAPIPANTHAVAMQEDVELLDEGKAIRLTEDYAEGEFIRRAGADLCRGQLLVRAGERLTPQRLAAAASQGKAELRCAPRTPVGILTTGDELVPPGSELAPGEIFNSNAPLVAALVRESGGRVAASVHGRDDREQLLVAAEELREADFVISCGGVSVGDHDHVRWLAAELGFETVFWGIRMQPGKPFLFAEHPDGRWWFGLPGNPASAFVCFQRLVAPAIRRRMGAALDLCPPPGQKALLDTPVRGKGDRPHYLRGRLTGGVFHPQGLQQSHAIAGLAGSDALLRVEPGEDLEAGAEVVVGV